ncbi:hypothetical protein PV08_11573 [Exophiala spinifera]|uniref:4-coumarate-CoA ligase n=1 Tax=Exophiala spinifera TaxID=91928 RepID=A0A0D2BGZ5_9EURO|nr:uncharacterized protein PV08_11573 [Exophiala spinifera]KIW10609.1 hypothetical protein PV08_11573 [Exophiala spinifera]
MSPRIFRSSFPPIDPIKVDLLSHLFSNPKNTPHDKQIYIDAVTGAVRTYGAIIQRTRSLAHGLRSLGVKPLDVVAFFSPNSIDYAITCYAILGCGAIISPVSAAYTAQELSSQLQTCGAKHLIAHSSLLDIAKSAVAFDPSILIIQADGERDASGSPTAETLASTCPASALVSISPSEASERLSFMCFSSGTTGAAKGVMTTHLNIVANTQQWQLHAPEESTGNITNVSFLPLSHIYGVFIVLIINMLVGNTTVLLPRFEPELFWSCLAKHRPETVHVVPPIMLLLAKYPNLERWDLSSLRRITSAAAPLSVELREAVERRFKTLYGTTLVCRQAWGMTETSPLGALVPVDRIDKRHTVGNVVSGMEFRVVDPETMRDVDDDPVRGDGSTKPGELWCRGPNVTKGYYRNDEATRNGFFRDPAGGEAPWFRTGDIGFIDGDGFVTIVDRIKEMIKYKGLQVIPSELEGKLLEHPDVEDACVVGIYVDAEATEVPVGFVVVSAQAKATSKKGGDKVVTDDVHTWLNARVANHKKLRGGLYIVDAIPKSPSGKILRRQLKADLEVKTRKSRGGSKL